MKFYSTTVFIFYLLFGQLCAQSLFDDKNSEFVNPNEILASVDTINITAEEFFYNYEFGPAFTKRNKDSKEMHLNYMINEKLLALEGYKNNLLDNAETKNIYNNIQDDLATEELFKNEILSEIKLSDKEINNIVNQKKIDLEIKWIYSTDENEINNISKLLNDQTLFDSLYNSQINDSVFVDQREMEISRFNLNKKNPTLARYIDSMKVGEITKPININDGWYIIKYDNKIVRIISTQAEYFKLSKEAEEALTKSKMDSLSDSYVNNLLFESKSTIKRDAFNILRSYLGKFILPKEKYDSWDLYKNMEIALSSLGIYTNEKYSGIILIESADKNYTLDDFLFWFQPRNLYIKFNKSSLKEYSKSVENCVWQMLRDNLLAQIAKEKNYYETDWVIRQSKWWKEKIVYSALRNQYNNSIEIKQNEKAALVNNDYTTLEIMSKELSQKYLHTILGLKQNIKIKVDKDLLNKIKVSSEDDKKIINFYSIKKGGLIPRPAYPSIDPDWASWE